MDDTTITSTIELDETVPAAATDAAAGGEPIDEELLVEEVSIDGMCGVY
jgi:mycofactocin precursor